MELNIDITAQENVQKWLNGNYDEETKEAIRKMIAENQNELNESFYKSLEFGTGGLRGIMGVGTNRMNKYTVAMATQGLANYVISSFKDTKKMGNFSFEKVAHFFISPYADWRASYEFPPSS